MEKTVQTIFEMSKTHSSEELARFVTRVGGPPVAKLRSWADAHIQFGAGASVDWYDTPRPPLLVQFEELTLLKNALDSMSEPTITVDTLSGRLLAADLEKRTFKMRLDSGELIVGTFEGAITERHKATLPQRYIAVVATTTVLRLALEKAEIKRLLLELTAPPEPDQRPLEPLP